MNSPKKSPAILTLNPGSYSTCSCGKSSKSPLCDGSHKGSSFTPIKLEIKQTQQVALCQCSLSSKKPFCDGSHSKPSS